MELTAEITRFIQKKLGFPDDQVDGQMGTKTEAALDAFLEEKKDQLSERHREAIFRGGRKRKATAFGQLVCLEHDIEVGPADGLLGTQSYYAFQVLLFFARYGRFPHAWRDHVDIPNPNAWPGDSQQALRDHFGDPGPNGADVPLVNIDLPYEHRFSWDKNVKVNRFKCHEMVADSMSRVLTKVHEHYGDTGVKELGLDLWGGCFNYRKKRGGSTLSTHSWGIALDYHPEENQLRWGWDEAVFARPDYDFWWQAWEEEGWVGLGRVRNYDWMHLQAARVPGLVG